MQQIQLFRERKAYKNMKIRKTESKGNKSAMLPVNRRCSSPVCWFNTTSAMHDQCNL